MKGERLAPGQAPHRHPDLSQAARGRVLPRRQTAFEAVRVWRSVIGSEHEPVVASTWESDATRLNRASRFLSVSHAPSIAMYFSAPEMSDARPEPIESPGPSSHTVQRRTR